MLPSPHRREGAPRADEGSSKNIFEPMMKRSNRLYPIPSKNVSIKILILDPTLSRIEGRSNNEGC